MPFAKVTSKGQITIPKMMRDSLKIKPGDRLQVKLDSDQQVIRLERSKSIEDGFGILYDPKRKPVSVEQMDKNLAVYFRKKYPRRRR